MDKGDKRIGYLESVSMLVILVLGASYGQGHSNRNAENAGYSLALELVSIHLKSGSILDF